MNSVYKQCNRCVLDTTVSDIAFDQNGICNYCHEYDRLAAKTILRPEKIKKKELDEIVSEIKNAGKNKDYDCILGVSGGVDSTYLALLTKNLKLRPLVVHFDNGWNSELAVKNIENIVSRLGYDLHTFVMEWEEFKDIQLAYLKASVLDIEVPTDQLIFAALYKLAAKHKIKYILSGHNISTEAVLPKSWYFSKFDLANLLDIHKKYGKIKLRKLPKIGLRQRYFYEAAFQIKMVSFLNYIPYIKSDIKKIIESELGWKDYGGKHYESIFTRFYQGYILPSKFNIDKRKAHLSNLIVSGQMSRDEALEQLKSPTYPPEQQVTDKEYVCKKLGLNKEEFQIIMDTPIRDHALFDTENSSWFHKKYFLFKVFVYIPARFFRLLNNSFFNY